MMREIDECRVDYEEYVKTTIKAHVHEEFLKVGSSHWLDFKAGWVWGRLTENTYD